MLGAGHVERAQRGIEWVDRVPAGGQHQIGPFVVQAVDLAGDGRRHPAASR